MRVVATLAVALLVTLGAGSPLILAQAPNVDGVYTLMEVDMEHNAGDKVRAPAEQKRMKDAGLGILYISKFKEDPVKIGKQKTAKPKTDKETPVYSWGEKNRSQDYSEYEPADKGLYFFCGSDSSGSITPDSGGFRLLMWSHMTQAGDRFYYAFDRSGPISGNPLPEGAPRWCSKKSRGPARPILAALPAVRPSVWPAFSARVFSAQTPVGPAQASEEAGARRVNGQLLLSTKNTDGYSASAADKDLWACLVRSGALSLEFAPASQTAGPQGPSTFVWPDGHFQGTFHARSRYTWKMHSPTCQIATPSDPKAAAFYVPTPSSDTDEKLVLACYVGVALTECDSWWLWRP